jgi:hypothetical protein
VLGALDSTEQSDPTSLCLAVIDLMEFIKQISKKVFKTRHNLVFCKAEIDFIVVSLTSRWRQSSLWQNEQA